MRKRKIVTYVMLFCLTVLMAMGSTLTVNAAAKKVKSMQLQIGSKSMHKKTYSMMQGNKTTLKVSVKPAAAGKKLIYKSSNPSVATVSGKGVIKAKKAGTAKISVTVSGKYKKTTRWLKVKVKSKKSKPKALVVYFSRAGENYNVGNITEGNTEIIAKMIADQTGAKSFRIETVDPYPSDYEKCKERAQREQDTNARPKIKGSVANWDSYDIIFLGYPIWYGDMPMAVYTFMEKYDFSGKTVVPFCTNEGSGLADTKNTITKVCKGAKVKKGLAIQGTVAQKQRSKARTKVQQWISALKIL